MTAPALNVTPEGDDDQTPAPSDLRARGRRLWDSIAVGFDLDVHEQTVLHDACRIADHLDDIADACAGSSVMVENFRGDPVASPAYVEHRQQAGVLARLLASLRIPESDEDGHDVRPQRRGQARGYYGVAANR